MQQIWNKKCLVKLVCTVVMGIVTKGPIMCLKTIPENHSIDSLHKTAVLGTWHMIREVLQSEAWSLSGDIHHWFKSINTRERKNRRRNDDDNEGTVQILKCFTSVCWRRWSQFVDCVKRYTDRCFTESRRQEFNKAVENPVDSVHQMCTVTKYQTGELCKPLFQVHCAC
jgi:hypothetical protein